MHRYSRRSEVGASQLAPEVPVLQAIRQLQRGRESWREYRRGSPSLSRWLGSYGNFSEGIYSSHGRKISSEARNPERESIIREIYDRRSLHPSLPHDLFWLVPEQRRRRAVYWSNRMTTATQDCERLKLRAAGMEPIPHNGRRDGFCQRGHDTNLPENQYRRGKYIDCAPCDRYMAARRRLRR